MTNTFSTTGGTTHATIVTGLADGTSYIFYVRAQDGAGNPNTDDYEIAFGVASALPPPVPASDFEVTMQAQPIPGITRYRFYGNNVLVGDALDSREYTYTLSAGQTHALTVAGVDDAGNEGPQCAAVIHTAATLVPTAIAAPTGFKTIKIKQL